MIESFLDSWELFAHAYLSGWLIAAVLGLVGVSVVARDQIFLGAAVAQASVLGITVGIRLDGGPGEGQPGALPRVVVVDLGDRGSEPLRELRLRGEQHPALLLQRVVVGKEQLHGEDSDVPGAHARDRPRGGRSSSGPVRATRRYEASPSATERSVRSTWRVS